MSTYNTFGTSHTQSATIRAYGCVLTEAVSNPPVESEKDRIERLAKRIAEEQIRKEVQALREAELRRVAQWDKKWTEAMGKLKEDIQQQLIDMALCVAEIILQHELPDQTMLRSIIEETISPISDLQGMRIRLSMSDMEAARQGTLTPVRGAGIEWIADATLTPGDMIIESRNGVFDGRLKERLGMLKEALKDPARHSSRHENQGVAA